MAAEEVHGDTTLARRANNGLLSRLQSPWPAVVLACLCFVNSLPNDLVYDDEHRVANKQNIRSLTNFRGIWLTDWVGPAPGGEAGLQSNSHLMYRPFTDFTFAINYALHGLSPTGFRAFNVLLHGLVCLLVWHFVRRLFSDSAIASWTAPLFAVHPIHCEGVIYIVGRAEQLVAVFVLLGLLVLLPRTGVAGPRRALLAMPLFFVGLLSKESAVCFIPVALIVLYAVRTRVADVNWRWWTTHVVVLLLPFLVYLSLRYVVLDYHLMRSRPYVLLNPLIDAQGTERVIGALTVLGHYTRLFLFPARLSVDYGLAVIEPQAGPNAMTWMGAMAAAALAAGLLGHLRRETVWRRIAVLCAMWLASYFVVSNTLMLIGTAVAERLMYWPSVPVLTLLAVGGIALWRKVGGSLV